MKIKYDKPTREIYDGYETEEVIFDVDYEDVVKAIFNKYYSNYDYETFRKIFIDFDIDLSDFIDDDDIKKVLYENYLQKCLWEGKVR